MHRKLRTADCSEMPYPRQECLSPYPHSPLLKSAAAPGELENDPNARPTWAQGVLRLAIAAMLPEPTDANPPQKSRGRRSRSLHANPPRRQNRGSSIPVGSISRARCSAPGRAACAKTQPTPRVRRNHSTLTRILSTEYVEKGASSTHFSLLTCCAKQLSPDSILPLQIGGRCNISESRSNRLG